MKTPEEIKKGLAEAIEEASWVVEGGDAHDLIDAVEKAHASMADALAYIRQLENREWDLFDLLSSAWYGKSCYFKQEDGTVYSRVSCEYMLFDQAIDEFAHKLTVEGESLAKDIDVPRWISVEERLPEVSDVVLVIANGKPSPRITLDNAYLIASYWGDEGWIADGFDGWDALQVTCWMPLPEPPKEVEA